MWLLAALIVVVAASVQSVTGMGFGLTALPVLTLIYGTRDGIVLNMVMSSATNVWVAWRTRKDAVPSLARPLAVGGVLGLIPGIAAYYLLHVQVLRAAIGAMLVFAVALRLNGRRLAVPHSRRASVATGTLSGLLSGSISLGGPPLSLYLSGGGLDKRAYRATIARYVLIPSAINVPAHLVGVPGHAWAAIGLGATAALFIPAGAMLGQFLFTRIHQVAFDRLVVAVILFAALTAVYQGASLGRLVGHL